MKINEHVYTLQGTVERENNDYKVMSSWTLPIESVRPKEKEHHCTATALKLGSHDPLPRLHFTQSLHGHFITALIAYS
jgi:hypothetical protein